MSLIRALSVYLFLSVAVACGGVEESDDTSGVENSESPQEELATTQDPIYALCDSNDYSACRLSYSPGHWRWYEARCSNGARLRWCPSGCTDVTRNFAGVYVKFGYCN